MKSMILINHYELLPLFQLAEFYDASKWCQKCVTAAMDILAKHIASFIQQTNNLCNTARKAYTFECQCKCKCNA